MTGLEKITDKIYEQSKQNCEEIFIKTNQQVKEIILNARAEADKKAKEIVSSAQKEADRKNTSAKSTAESITRNRYLEVRNAILNDVISAAYEEIEKFSDEEYFEMILKLFRKNIQPGECTMYFGGYDLSRLPENFQDTLNEEVADFATVFVSSEEKKIENGFLLDYGDTQINCTFKAIFDENMDRLKDILSKELFS